MVSQGCCKKRQIDSMPKLAAAQRPSPPTRCLMIQHVTSTTPSFTYPVQQRHCSFPLPAFGTSVDSSAEGKVIRCNTVRPHKLQQRKSLLPPPARGHRTARIRCARRASRTTAKCHLSTLGSGNVAKLPNRAILATGKSSRIEPLTVCIPCSVPTVRHIKLYADHQIIINKP